MHEVQLLCDDIAIIHRGRLFFSGAKEVFEAQMTQGNPGYVILGVVVMGLALTPALLAAIARRGGVARTALG